MIPSLKQLARDKVANTLSANTHLVFAAPNAPQELRLYHDFILREQKKRSGHSLPAAASPGPEHQADGGTAQPARRAAAAKRSRGQSAAPPAGTPSPPGPTATLLRSPTTEARPAALPCAMARRGRAAPGLRARGRRRPARSSRRRPDAPAAPRSRCTAHPERSPLSRRRAGAFLAAPCRCPSPSSPSMARPDRQRPTQPRSAAAAVATPPPPGPLTSAAPIGRPELAGRPSPPLRAAPPG